MKFIQNFKNKALKKHIYILIIVLIAAAFFLPFQFLLNFAHDDSFFYIKTANNLAKGLGSTFDGINLTNGYHPLYFICLVVLFFLPDLFLNASPELIYRIVVSFHFLMIVLIYYFLNESLKKILKDEFGKIVKLVLFFLLAALVFIRDFGLESHIACLVLSYFIYIKANEIETGKNYIIDKSVLFTLLFLTRTDYLYSVIPAVLIADIFISDKKTKYIITSGIFLIMTAVVYYTSNYIAFGNIDTVSGKMLNAFPHFLLFENIKTLITDPAKLYNQFARVIFLLFSVVLFILFFIKRRKTENKKNKFYILLLCAGSGSVLFTFFHLLFNNYSIREWYMTLPVFISSVLLIVFLSNKKITAYITLFLSFIVLIYVFYGSRINNYKYVSGYEYSKALESLVKEDECIFQVDYCGVTGFFSNRKVINGDGLINSFEYQQYLSNGKIGDYLEKYDVKYYSTYSSKNIYKDSIYIDDNFSDKTNGKEFIFGKPSLVLEMPFKWNHIAFDLEGRWYLFKLK